MSFLNPVKQSILLSALLISTTNAASVFPRGCEVSGFAFEKNNIILNESGDQSYYLIQNHANTKIDLERYETDEAFMSPPLQASIDPANWAAFASDVKNINFKCYKYEGDKPVLTDCREVLDVCRYPRVRFALSNMGNYWISINKPQNGVIADSVAKGIYLKW